MFHLIARLPQPLKALYLAFYAAFAATFATFFVGGDRATAAASGALGAVAALTGLTLVTNLNGAATALAEATAAYRPMGVDYSRSFFARPWIGRLFGVAMLAVGTTFVVAAVTTY